MGFNRDDGRHGAPPVLKEQYNGVLTLAFRVNPIIQTFSRTYVDVLPLPCMAYKGKAEGGGIHCANVVQSYCNRVSDAGGRGNTRMID